MESGDVGTLSGIENTWVKKPNGTFAGVPYFDCDHDTFSKCLKGKKKGGHWSKFLGDSDFSKGVKGWIKTQKDGGNFMLRSTKDGTFIFARKVVM